MDHGSGDWLGCGGPELRETGIVMRGPIAITLILVAAAAVLLVLRWNSGGLSSDDSVPAPISEGHGPPEFAVRDIPDDPGSAIDWKEFAVQGVAVLIPTSRDGTWQGEIKTDICDPLRAQYLVGENTKTGTRFRVDLKTRDIVLATGARPTAADDAVITKIRSSFRGTFTGDPRLNGTPRPTPLYTCDQPQDPVPPLAPTFEPPPAQVTEEFTPTLEPTSTPAPYPIPSRP